MQNSLKCLKRRDFLRLAAVGGAAFASALPGFSYGRDDDFYFVQLSDAHWGFEGPGVNPDSKGTLPKAIAAVNALPSPPDFVIQIVPRKRTKTRRKLADVGYAPHSTRLKPVVECVVR
ncbi:hypothetical protein Bphy_0908 [Paraburkholderia phymatum STM815]|uniref:Metallophosphoesterase n=1 Tax=Paraburkholderia phymatum (strain DSM 17167 / CIP 108236 / LMG 21445 / STM815) TaxID=391038 RepID=B2JG15_PARP8|nr:hypothetical protein Bphy_0908 [Paraburkholderia phymatum STM815]